MYARTHAYRKPESTMGMTFVKCQCVGIKSYTELCDGGKRKGVNIFKFTNFMSDSIELLIINLIFEERKKTRSSKAHIATLNIELTNVTTVHAI